MANRGTNAGGSMGLKNSRWSSTEPSTIQQISPMPNAINARSWNPTDSRAVAAISPPATVGRK